MPENGGFTEFVWVNEEEVKKYKCIDGITEEVIETIKHFKEHRI